MARQDDIKKLVDIHSRRLQKLEEQEAIQGISVDPRIPLEIERIREQIEALQTELAKIEGTNRAAQPIGPHGELQTAQKMSFLDEHPPDWTRPELPHLRDLFVMAYGRPTAAEELAKAAGIELGTFPLHDNMRTTWFKLIEVMSLQDKLRVMVEKAAADPTVGSYQQRFAEMLQEKPTVPVPEPGRGSDWWKGATQDPRIARTLHLERLLEQRSRLIHIDIARQVVQLSRSVAKLGLRFEKERAHGTGFLIQPNLILTNHHNVFNPGYGDLQGINVEFDYEHGFTGKPLVCKGLVDSIIKHEAHDWAVIRLETPVDRQPIALGTPYDLGQNDSVIIIQHPLGSYKQFALDMLSIQYIDDELIQYLADTQKGSSGSPVFNVQMHVIALHHAEAEVTLQLDGREEVEWRNEGIRIEQVMRDLTAQGIKFEKN